MSLGINTSMFLRMIVQCILHVLFGGAAVNTTCFFFFSGHVQIICLSSYNFCVSITAVQTLCLRSFFSSPLVYSIHGGESRDILHIYSDRTGKHIRHYFFNAE